MPLPSPSLFWRTFLWIVALIIAILLAWAQSFRLFEREPRARQIAQQVVSIVNITRSALVYSDAAYRRQLLRELADNEGVRIVPREPGDDVTPWPDDALMRAIAQRIFDRLGPDTELAVRVNGVPGLWVSFDIDGDDYWVYIERDPLVREAGTQWVRWAIVAAALSLLVAVAITGVVNRPLRRLADAARALGSGRIPERLPEHGPTEIRAVNRSFNRMVAALAQLEQDRAVLLAGISHDLRTPLARMRLEVEMLELPEATRAAMVADIEQMDDIIGQFLDYARPAPQHPKQLANLAALLEAALVRARLPDTQVTLDIDPQLTAPVHATEVARALDNLLANAHRYGRRPEDGRLDLTLLAHRDGTEAVLVVADRGPGIAPAEVERLLRPFERGEAARSGTRGAGLGLAIVERVARLHGGRLELLPNLPRGLRIELRLPLA
ncbi:MAG: ATP-binding protein [Sutterellaceae bacterium]|nr:ATP-binding protein [Burkholderiaceae bacterium]MDW8429347.1 ATP-binding protein [Sutterellaceae bacterium]